MSLYLVSNGDIGLFWQRTMVVDEDDLDEATKQFEQGVVVNKLHDPECKEKEDADT